jgi:hypothetical protein
MMGGEVNLDDLLSRSSTRLLDSVEAITASVELTLRGGGPNKGSSTLSWSDVPQLPQVCR